MRLLEKFIAPLGCVMYSCYGAFGLLHIWTIIAAYKVHGLIGAVIGALLFGVAEAYFAVILWKKFGFMNWYTLAVATVIAVYTLASLLATTIEYVGLSEPSKKKPSE